MPSLDRSVLVTRSRRLTLATLLYNSLEALIAVGAGLTAGSIALVGFGIDSLIELAASMAGLWRLGADAEPGRRVRVERHSLQLIGASFLALAGYLVYEAGSALWSRQAAAESPVGIALAILSLGVMPWLARRKRRLARQLNSGALAAEATQTQLCAYLSAILLGGLGLNAVLGWWWADPVAALAMVPFIAREGVDGVRGRSPCCTDSHSVPGGDGSPD
jgi:divalent metal cation (Fe/Co/Zn/Cd) transporter